MSLVFLSQLQSDWEAVSLELEQWVVCVRQLEDVLVLQTLLLVPLPKGLGGGSAMQCSIKTLLEGGRGELQRKITTHPNETYLENVHFEVVNM